MQGVGVLGLRFFDSRRLPVLRQSEAAECGLVCLAMVASYWGHRLDVGAMRQRFAVSLKGTTLRTLLSMAERLHLQARPLKLDIDHLGQLRLPCVLHWDMQHFVVLKSVKAGTVVIHDPAVGERTIPMQEVSRRFTGVAVELVPAAGFEQRDERQRVRLRSLVGRVVGLRRGLLQVLALAAALQLCALLGPFYLQWVIDEALVSADRDLVTVLGTGFILLVLLQAGVGAVRSWLATVLTTSFNFQWLGNAFAHLLQLPLSWFEKRHVGDVVSRFGSLQTVQRTLTTQSVEAVLDGLLVTTTLLLMLQYSVPLTMVSIGVVAVYAALRSLLFTALRGATADQIVASAKQQTHFLESVRGAQAVRLFNRADSRRTGWMNMLAEQFNADLRIARLTITHQGAQALLFGGERIAVIWLAALAVLDARFTVGMLFAYTGFKDQFTQRVTALVDRIFEFRMLRLHAERLADVLLEPPEPAHGPDEAVQDDRPPSIELRDVGFRYADGEPPVLQGVSLRIEPGDCLAIAGASGCGKTTLVKVLLGLIEPTEGQVLVDGRPLRRYGLVRHRDRVGTVMQDDQLFTGTIADNIAFFDPSPELQRIHACAQLAALHADISAMPMAYSTLVGDGGAGLSGGQRQRILLARALYKQPQVLVLDEATSHLDVANEQLVNAAIKQIALTRIIVAHRPDTIAMAQRVVVLQQGRVVRDFQQHVAAAA
ncbi:peptidase domain-containing ABC transporter [Ramlibacter algicola]|uniref:Cyclolysin secretion/processing ATP-binding protein CyaB n=1 Tax=Ramlibacter algicola TaxID=2795217 RepID=A0A934Q024_9BURK|nr:peptidase domain-containing ABC transporter [Ramlibacter algicola]MBK0392001.1 peptidase domain-containing ABC transporter [Ramlibacter algicola]